MSKMTSGVASAPLAQIDAPLLAVALAQGSVLPTSLGDLDRAAGGVVARVITSGDFKGKRDETTLLYPTGAKSERVLLVGLGKPGEVTRNAIRRAAAVAAKRTRALGVKQLAFAVAPEARNGVSARDLGPPAARGGAQGRRSAWRESGGAAAAPRWALGGRGVTVDPGGFSIRPAKNGEDVRSDARGADAVPGASETQGLQKPKLNVGGLIPA